MTAPTAPDYSDLDRIGYQVHPAAEAFDPYTDAELDALVENIRAHGVLNPITLSQDDGSIIDGVHRARAVARIRAEGGKEFLPARRLPDGRDPVEWAKANNDIRRHRPTVLEAAALTTTKPTGGRPETSENSEVLTRKQAAEKAGVSPDTITHARKVVEKSPPEVQEAVEDGLVSVSDAAAVADQPETVQLHALADVAAGTHRTLKKAAQANVEASQPEPSVPTEEEVAEAKAEYDRLIEAANQADREWEAAKETSARWKDKLDAALAGQPEGKALAAARAEVERLEAELELALEKRDTLEDEAAAAMVLLPEAKQAEEAARVEHDAAERRLKARGRMGEANIVWIETHRRRAAADAKPAPTITLDPERR